MAYSLYNTEGIVLGYQDVGEADRMFSVFTKDFGKLNIFAKSARLQKSKLAPSLNLFSCSRLSFVSGKDLWRLVDASEITPFDPIEQNFFNFFSFGAIASFLDRMVKGEERDEKLWGIIKSAFLFLKDAENLSSPALREAFELLTKLRILHSLGYVDFAGRFASDGGSEASNCLTNSEYNAKLLETTKKHSRLFRDLIEKGVSASSL